MKRYRAGILGDVLLVQRELRPQDEATRKRLDELMLGRQASLMVSRQAAPFKPPRITQPDTGGPVDSKPYDVQPAPGLSMREPPRGWRTIQTRVTLFVGVPLTIVVIVGYATGPRKAAAVVALAALPVVATSLFARRRPPPSHTVGALPAGL